MRRVAYYKGCLASLSAKELDVSTQGNVLTLRRRHATLVADFGAKTVELHA